MVRLVAILLAAALLAVLPARALAATQTNPFLPQQEQPQPSQVEEVPPPAAPVQQQDTGLDSGTATLLIVAAVALIAGIWVAITRDARRATAGRVRTRTARADPFEVPQGASPTRTARKTRKQSPAERRRRKRGRAR
jgi:uncharacterized protein HemX